MAYTKQEWIDYPNPGYSKLTKARADHIEDGIEAAAATADQALAAVGSTATDAEAARVAAEEAAANAALSASLVHAPADSAVAAIVGNSASDTSAVLSSTFAAGVSLPDSDDAATLQAVLDSAPAGSVVTSRHTHTLSAPLTIPAGVTLDGVTLTFSSAAATVTGGAVKTGGAGAVIRNCTISVTGGDYRRTVSLDHANTEAIRNTISVSTAALPTGTAHFAIFSADNGSQGGVVIEGNDITISNVPTGDGVQASSRPGIRVTNNRIHDFASMAEVTRYSWAIYVSKDCPGAVISGNVIEDVLTSGINVSNETSGVAADSGRRITGNTVRTARFIGIAVTETRATVVSGNAVSGCDILVSVNSAAVAPTITGNTFESVVNLGSPIDVDRPMVSVSAAGSSVVGNSIDKRGTSYVGVKLVGTSCSVVGNTFGATRPRSAVTAGTPATKALIAGNVVNTTDDTTAGNCLAAEGDDSVISGNIVTMPAVGVGIRLNGDNCRAIGNKVTGGATGMAVMSASTSSTVAGNTVTGAGTPLFDGGTTTKKYQNTGVTPVAVTGSRGGNAALANLLTQLVAAELITDSTSA